MNVQAGHGGSSSAPSATGAIAIVPRINVQAFCIQPDTVENIKAAFADRRMSRAHVTVMTGGIPAAVRLYQTQNTPNLLIVESDAARDGLLDSLSSLAEVCQPDTKVMVIGHMNDIILYRELIRQGVSEYIVAPIAPIPLIETISALYRNERAVPIGRVIAFMGVKGGVGSSVISHNCAWELARTIDVETTIIDLDIAYGTGALDFNLDASGGIMEALAQPDRVDPLLLDRLLVRLGGKLSLLGGPGGVDKDVVIEAHAVETILTAMRASVPLIVVDIPDVWAPWVRFTLLHADQVVLTAEPDLASLRNARALVELLKAARPNDPPPMVVLNQVGMPKRPEISAADFKKAIGADLTSVIPFDPQNFGAALNSGKTLFEAAPRSKVADLLRKLAVDLAGERSAKPTPAGGSLVKKILALGRK